MNDLNLFFTLGFQHITDPNGYDHILFLIALCAVYCLTDWRRVLILVTAFTVGHSLTLGLASIGVISIQSEIIELLIPITIIFTAIENLRIKDEVISKKDNIRYVMALIFGLVHGLGFSNYLRSLLGRETSILKPLFAFNVGLEIGQILIVTIILGAACAAMKLKYPRYDWKVLLSGAAIGISILLIKDRLPLLWE